LTFHMLRLVLFSLLATAIYCQAVSEDILCEGRSFEPKCPQGTIRIISGSFGKTDAAFCGGTDTQPWSVNCGVDVTETLRGSCGGKSTCSVKVEGQDVCFGTSKYLQTIWTCDNGIVQNKVNNRGVDIVVSASTSRDSPIALHGQTLTGASNYIFVNPANSINQVRWFIDRADQVVATETATPFDLSGGRPWDSTSVTDGSHRIIATITFSDGTSGSIDSTFVVRNGAQAAAARAVAGASDTFVETGVVNENSTSAATVPNTLVLPWSLFSVACFVIVVLSVVIVLKKSTSEHV